MAVQGQLRVYASVPSRYDQRSGSSLPRTSPVLRQSIRNNPFEPTACVNIDAWRNEIRIIEAVIPISSGKSGCSLVSRVPQREQNDRTVFAVELNRAG